MRGMERGVDRDAGAWAGLQMEYVCLETEEAGAALARRVSDPGAGIQIRASGGDPDFGQGAPSDSAAIAVRVKGRTIAVLTVERSASVCGTCGAGSDRPCKQTSARTRTQSPPHPDRGVPASRP